MAAGSALRNWFRRAVSATSGNGCLSGNAGRMPVRILDKSIPNCDMAWPRGNEPRPKTPRRHLGSIAGTNSFAYEMFLKCRTSQWRAEKYAACIGTGMDGQGYAKST